MFYVLCVLLSLIDARCCCAGGVVAVACNVLVLCRCGLDSGVGNADVVAVSCSFIGCCSRVVC